MKISRVCQHCNKPFQTHESEIRRRGGRYCSRSCYYAGRSTPLALRFWSKVHRVDVSDPDSCFVWTGAKTPSGYGHLQAHGSVTAAHRVGYELQVGPIPDGLHICHRCDNPACVRGSHLFLGTNTENRRDSVSKQRHARGHKKLTPENVDAIRVLLANGVPQKKIAGQFKVCQSVISDIAIGKSWSWHQPLTPA